VEAQFRRFVSGHGFSRAAKAIDPTGFSRRKLFASGAEASILTMLVLARLKVVP
jgi:hypothetical protein